MSRNYGRLAPEQARRIRTTISQTKESMALGLTVRIREELASNPDVTEFRTPLIRSLSPLESHFIRHTPEEIAGRVAVGRCVRIEIDETTEPAELVITLSEQS